MILSDEVITRLQSNSDFSFFRDFVFQEVNKLNSVDGLEKLSNEKAGEEAKIRHKTLEKLLDILNPIMNFGERKGATKEEIKNAEKAHGL